MKKMFLGLVLAAVMYFVAVQQIAAQEGAMAGVTTGGIAFISDEWVKKTGYGQPYFASQELTHWKRQLMKLNSSGYWEYNVGRQVSGSVTFCFELDMADKYIPHVLVDDGTLKEGEEGVVDNRVGGYNFRTTPVPQAPWERE